MSKVLKAKAWLFDLDGTLIDTAPDLGAAANRVRGECGLPPLPQADYRPQASSGARGLLRVALNMEPEHPDFPLRRDSFLAYYRASIAEHSAPFAGISQLLLALELRALRWGVVTNKPGWLTQPLMQALGLAERAACLVSGDATEHPKPAPDNLLLASQEIGINPEDCLYVGDDQRDIQAARAAGMTSIAAGWGYAGRETSAWKADVSCDTVDELHGLLP